jgi:Flp pilus assembly protein TadD
MNLVPSLTSHRHTTAQLTTAQPTTAHRLALAISAAAVLAITGCASSTNAPQRAVNTLCEPAAQLKDYDQRTLLGVGYEAIQQNKLVCAERLLTEANRLDPKDPWTLLNLGVAQQRLGKLDPARLSYQMAGALDPKTSGIEIKAKAISEQKQELSVVASQDTGLKKPPGQIALDNLARMR